MNKILGLILLIIAIIGISGCVQVEQPEAVEEVPQDTSKIAPLDGVEPEAEEIPEPEAEEPEEEEVVEVTPAGPWCDQTDLNIFVEPYVSIRDVSIFVDENYDKDFGPNKVTQLFQNDELIGYVELELPTKFRYSDLQVQGRFVNGDNMTEGAAFTKDDLIKYGDYHHQTWKGAKAVNLENMVFETKVTYIVEGVAQTQCESYAVPVVELESSDVSDNFYFNQIVFSRSRIFILEGNFLETLYDTISNDFKATFQAVHVTNPELHTDVKFELLNKIVCVGSTCYLKGEVNIPRNTLGAYSVHDQWCSDTFERRLRVDRGIAQPLYAKVSDQFTSLMCNKLTTV